MVYDTPIRGVTVLRLVHHHELQLVLPILPHLGVSVKEVQREVDEIIVVKRKMLQLLLQVEGKFIVRRPDPRPAIHVRLDVANILHPLLQPYGIKKLPHSDVAPR